MWVDVSNKTLLGHKPPPIETREAQRLNNDPRVQERYTEIYKMRLKEFGEVEKLRKVDNEATTYLSPHLANLYDKAEQLAFKAATSAYKKC